MLNNRIQALCKRLRTFYAKLLPILIIRFVYRAVPSSSSGSGVTGVKKIPLFRFTVRVADATGEVDIHLFGKEAERFLGVTAYNFNLRKIIRRKVELKLQSLCQSQLPSFDPAPVPAMTTRRVTRGSHTQQQQQQQQKQQQQQQQQDMPTDPASVTVPVPASVPLLAINLFSYLPATHTGEGVVRLAVVGTSLYQL